MNTEIDMTKERVLLTFAGNTDPTRGQHDGPILHICRYYRPQKIYLILTKEMQERDEKPHDFYRRALDRNLPGYEYELIRFRTDIVDAHKFESYFDIVYKVFEQIKKDSEGKDIEVLVNLTSGTTQMASNLVTYIVDAENLKLTPVQVSTPERKSNTEKPVGLDYDVGLEAEMNLDNEGETVCRLISPDLRRYTRIRLKSQVGRLLDRYEYVASIELLKQKVFDKDQELNTLLNFALERRVLSGLESNAKLHPLSNKNYDKLYYYTKSKKETRVPLWYEVADYFALALTKEKVKDISGYSLMIEPFTVNLYLSILSELFGKNLNQLFEAVYSRKKTSSADVSYKISTKKLGEELKKKIEKDMNIFELKEGTYISDKVLVSMICYFIEEKEEAKRVVGLEDFKELSETLEKVKPVRNMLAHSLKSITEHDFREEAGVEVSKVSSTIKNFLTKYYTPLGFKPSMLDIYDNINKEIKRILEEEK